MSYTSFDDLCGIIEARFGGVRGLELKQSLDLTGIQVMSGPILDFGSGKFSPLGRCLKLDPDITVDANYRSIDDIPDDLQLHGILANQVFEHIPRDEIQTIIKRLVGFMCSGISMIITLPNICNWFKYVGDVDHVSPLTFYQMGAYMEQAGLEVVDAYYYTKRPREITNASEQERVILNTLQKFFEMHPAHFVAIRGKKK